MRVLDTDAGYRIELSGWVSASGTREQIIPIYIDPSLNTGLKARFDEEMKKRYDTTSNDLIRKFAETTKLD